MDRITVNVKAPGTDWNPIDIEVEKRARGWITTDHGPADTFQPGMVELTLIEAPDGVDFHGGRIRSGRRVRG